MDLYEKIRSIAGAKRITIAQIERDLGLAKGSMRKWKVSTPSAQRLRTIADYLDVNIEQLLGSEEIAYEETTHTWEPESKKNENAMHIRDVFPITEYYIYEQTREITDFLMHHPEYSLLFDASRKVKPEDIEKAIKILDVLSK